MPAHAVAQAGRQERHRAGGEQGVTQQHLWHRQAALQEAQKRGAGDNENGGASMVWPVFVLQLASAWAVKRMTRQLEDLGSPSAVSKGSGPQPPSSFGLLLSILQLRTLRRDLAGLQTAAVEAPSSRAAQGSHRAVLLPWAGLCMVGARGDLPVAAEGSSGWKVVHKLCIASGSTGARAMHAGGERAAAAHLAAATGRRVVPVAPHVHGSRCAAELLRGPTRGRTPTSGGWLDRSAAARQRTIGFWEGL